MAFKGFLYVKRGGIGTRSEGPEYWLQTLNQEYQLHFHERLAWEPDYELEFHNGHIVEVQGEVDAAGDIRVTGVETLPTDRIPDRGSDGPPTRNGNFAPVSTTELMCDDWRSWHDPALGALRVSGKCRFPTAGWAAGLRKREPQGFNPHMLMLDLVIERPHISPQVLTELIVEWTEPESSDFFDQVCIFVTGIDAPSKLLDVEHANEKKS